MITIKCSEREKRDIIDALTVSNKCLFDVDTCNGSPSCEVCLETNIKFETQEEKTNVNFPK